MDTNHGPLDPRVEKTREALAQALVDLVAESSWETLTVAAVCRRARIHRATFYAHYEDKRDLLARCLPSLFDTMVGDRALGRLFHHARDHRVFYQRALGRGGEFRDLFTAYLCRHALAAPAPGTSARSDLAVRAGVGALLGVLEWFVTAEPTPDPEATATEWASLMSSRGPGQQPQHPGPVVDRGRVVHHEP